MECPDRGSRWIMTYKGTVKNGVIVLPPEVELPEGAEVDVTPRKAVAEPDTFLALVEQLAKPRPHWPPDYVVNHGHYVSGEPKKS
jgi:hypothetical protein